MHSGELVCLHLPRPKEQTPQDRWDLILAALCGWGGLAQPAIPVGPVWGLGLRRPLMLALALALVERVQRRPSSCS